MEYALKTVMKAENSRVAELREILIGSDRSKKKEPSILYDEENPDYLAASNILNDSQANALDKILDTQDIAFVHGPPGTGKTTTLVQAFGLPAK